MLLGWLCLALVRPSPCFGALLWSWSLPWRWSCFGRCFGRGSFAFALVLVFWAWPGLWFPVLGPGPVLVACLSGAVPGAVAVAVGAGARSSPVSGIHGEGICLSVPLCGGLGLFCSRGLPGGAVVPSLPVVSGLAGGFCVCINAPCGSTALGGIPSVYVVSDMLFIGM